MAEDTRAALFQMGSLRAGHRDPSWTLLEGHGVRAFEQVIRFTRPYRHTPTVEVALNFIDMEQDGANPRLGVEAININTEGFQLRIFTWWDTHVHEVGATWLAIGEPA